MLSLIGYDSVRNHRQGEKPNHPIPTNPWNRSASTKASKPDNRCRPDPIGHRTRSLAQMIASAAAIARQVSISHCSDAASRRSLAKAWAFEPCSRKIRRDEARTIAALGVSGVLARVMT